MLAPGPITAATLAAGTRQRHAGALIGAGHMIVEGPLILLIAAGAGVFLDTTPVRATIGLIGGLFLVFMGIQLLRSLAKPDAGNGPTLQKHPLWIGIILSAANPYFILWWITVGLALVTQAAEFGMIAVALFAAVHWMCDVGWLEFLSLAGHKGATALPGKTQAIINAVCGAALLFFGAKFIYDAGMPMLGPV